MSDTVTFTGDEAREHIAKLTTVSDRLGAMAEDLSKPLPDPTEGLTRYTIETFVAGAVFGCMMTIAAHAIW